MRLQQENDATPYGFGSTTLLNIDNLLKYFDTGKRVNVSQIKIKCTQCPAHK
jgi:hypothetical protein